ncbi:MAG: hypothetical protein ACI30I_07395 [Parabacteroides sp.]
MTALLEVNKKMGKDLAEAKACLEKANKRIDVLNSEVNYLKGKQVAEGRTTNSLHKNYCVNNLKFSVK